MRFRYLSSPLGSLLLAGDEKGLRYLAFEHGWYPIEPGRDWKKDDRFDLFARVERELRSYFRGKLRSFSVPLAPEGTAFQLRVWRALRRVPYGKTLSYTDLARRAGRPEAVRAAGAANARNPISIIIPCHRVVGRDGSLTGYGGGLDAKRSLLELEGARASETRDTTLAP
jgi:methylated-DNA-[protein]-cysteine S-methyltransferase